MSDHRWGKGDRVRHRFSNWTGTVRTVSADDGGAGQGPLVTVTDVRAGTPHVWADITVTSDELEALDAQAESADRNTTPNTEPVGDTNA